MFRHQITGFFGFLALTLALQGAGALWVLHHAEQQVQRGRIASDIHNGFVELSALQQRLRAWVTHYKVGAEGDLSTRDSLLEGQRKIIADLYPLVLDHSPKAAASNAQTETLSRINDLRILDNSIDELEIALTAARPLPASTQARTAWERLDRLFEQSNGHNLQSLILNRIDLESANIHRERLAADSSLALTRNIWLTMSLTLVLSAFAATLYFFNRLRKPVDELLNAAQALSHGNFNHRTDLRGQDEFGIVARSMNAMAIRLAEYETAQTQQRQHLESLVGARTQALEEANHTLRETDTRRRQLLADISHELRTPTTAILGEAEVTLRGRERSPSEYQQTLERIADVARQLGAVIDDLLAMSSTDIQDLRMSKGEVDLKNVLDRVIQQAQSLAYSRHVEFHYPQLQAQTYLINGDEQRLAQLIMLLLDNAIAYSAANGWVELSLHPSTSGKDELVISVTDNGMGIPSHEMPHIFERRFRGQAAKNERHVGTGLGLSIARMLAHAHGGSLELMSPVQAHSHRGTQARIVLPLIPKTPPHHSS